jgi:hypothetical protein
MSALILTSMQRTYLGSPEHGTKHQHGQTITFLHPIKWLDLDNDKHNNQSKNQNSSFTRPPRRQPKSTQRSLDTTLGMLECRNMFIRLDRSEDPLFPTSGNHLRPYGFSVDYYLFTELGSELFFGEIFVSAYYYSTVEE